MNNVAERDQLNLIRIGRMIEREYPDIEFKDMDEMRLYLNKHLGTSITTGMDLGEVATQIFNGRLHTAWLRVYGVV